VGLAYVLLRVRVCMRLSAMEGVSDRRSALTFHEVARGNDLGVLWSARDSIETDRIAVGEGRCDRDVKGAPGSNRAKDQYSSRRFVGSPSGLRVVKRAFPRSRSHRRARALR
jgi:hypothetical protein